RTRSKEASLNGRKRSETTSAELYAWSTSRPLQQSTFREEILVGSRPAVDIEDVARPQGGERSCEVVDEVAQVEIEIVGSAGVPARAPDLLDRGRGERLPARSGYSD